MKTNITLEKSLSTLSKTGMRSFIELLSNTIISLATGMMIVGIENIPKPFDKEMLAFISKYSLEHEVSIRKSLYTRISYVLSNAEQVVECINLRRLSDVFVLCVTEKQPLHELKNLQYHHDVNWYMENHPNMYAVCFITTEQMVSLQIASSYIGCNKILEQVLLDLKSSLINIEDCEARLIF